jgi:hypothetical protein
MIAWLGAAAIGIVNGVLREATYGKRLDESNANRLSASTAIADFALRGGISLPNNGFRPTQPPPKPSDAASSAKPSAAAKHGDRR